ncbi:carbohydrate ABC transporter permease [Paenibacillus hamazuiensis]|uniref:carbohydrate ABC transporter permease n=1 Tax=Paenibacillus hamazuiensis TaxID=2936508 RepID=UPI00200EEB34|nr:carbohydrate ABC transporter permease [Paenibacillus hamazuiensis]
MVRETTFGSKAFDVLLIVLLVGIALLCILPLWYTLCVSLSANSAAAAGMVGLWPVGFNFNSYNEIMGDSKFFNSFWISVKRVVLGAGVSFIVTVLMAYPLSKNAKEFPLRNVFMWILVFTMLFNGGLIPWYQTVKALGLINSIWALVLGHSVPMFNVILVVNYFRNLPKELEEAALVDGAGPWYMLVKLYIPLAVPVLATVTLFSIVYHWNEFFNGLVLMSKADHYPLQTYIQQLVVVIDASTMDTEQLKRLSELSNQTLNAAKIFIAMIPVLLIYPFLQRFFIHGITLGSVKE